MPTFCGLKLQACASTGFAGCCASCTEFTLDGPASIGRHGTCAEKRRRGVPDWVWLHSSCTAHKPGPLPAKVTEGSMIYFEP